MVTLWSGYYFILSHITRQRKCVNNNEYSIGGGRWPCNIITAFGFVGSEVDVTKFSVVWPTCILCFISFQTNDASADITVLGVLSHDGGGRDDGYIATGLGYYTRNDETKPRPMNVCPNGIPLNNIRKSYSGKRSESIHYVYSLQYWIINTIRSLCLIVIRTVFTSIIRYYIV